MKLYSRITNKWCSRWNIFYQISCFPNSIMSLPLNMRKTKLQMTNNWKLIFSDFWTSRCLLNQDLYFCSIQSMLKMIEILFHNVLRSLLILEDLWCLEIIINSLFFNFQVSYLSTFLDAGYQNPVKDDPMYKGTKYRTRSALANWRKL